jgi:hypothetical protein
LPCSTSIVAFDGKELTLERLGSLGADVIARIAERHGLTLQIGAAAGQRVPVRRLPRRQARVLQQSQ